MDAILFGLDHPCRPGMGLRAGVRIDRQRSAPEKLRTCEMHHRHRSRLWASHSAPIATKEECHGRCHPRHEALLPSPDDALLRA